MLPSGFNLVGPYAQIDKSPQAGLPYTLIWSNWLVGSDTLTVSTWTVDPGLTVITSSFTATSSQITLSGGTTGTTYLAHNDIVTAGGLVERRTIQITIIDR